jgi:hypothetical protein
MFSAVPPTADIHPAVSKPYRFTLEIPACVTVDATGLVHPGVSGSSSPSARMPNFSTAVGRITFSLADLGDVVAHGAEIAGQRRAGYPHASLDLTA